MNHLKQPEFPSLRMVVTVALSQKQWHRERL